VTQRTLRASLVDDHPAAMLHRAVLLFAVSAVLAVPAEARRRSVGTRPPFPPCSMITGSGAVTFTHDQGLTLAPAAVPARPISYTYGVTTLPDEPKTVVAWHRDDLLISTDSGCSWRVAATVRGSDFPPKLEPAGGGRVYAWSENRPFLVRYDARGAVKLKPPADFVGFTADPANGDRVRAGAIDGSLWETLDAGESWTRIGAHTVAPLYYRFAFNPQNLDHILAGTVSHGAFVSRDGGRTWTQANGIAPEAMRTSSSCSSRRPIRIASGRWASTIRSRATATRRTGATFISPMTAARIFARSSTKLPV
jgi:hypothetical protein